MINPEEIYQLLQKEQWSNIIDILHKNKNEIANEPSLINAAQTFETVFLQKVREYPKDNKDINGVLGLLYVLHHGKFYKLTETNLKKLTIELAERSPFKEAYNYAKQYPDEEICKEIITNYESIVNEIEEARAISHSKSTINWIEVYNRLFELINNPEDVATYFSGPRFINAVREILPYHPDYSQYIQLRGQEGKSTSRRIFYYDILMDIDELTRIRIVDKITSIVKPFLPEKVQAIDMIMGKKVIDNDVISATKTESQADSNPVVFISYSWDDEAHKEWVLNLANKLTTDGVKVILDRYSLTAGKSVPFFIEQSISQAHKILIIFTPNYKLKADKRAGGVGYEYSIMNIDLYKNQTTNEKIIPVLRTGEMKESIPEFMQQFIHLDLRKDENFHISYSDLIREIYNEPAIIQPEIGNKPNFN
ncbi:toll/interleukin-1 receptor domain-containing protein [Chitinophaga sancti]|uniref:SEFIR domain-containing protein n=1 Tax=Chitinophaga sancti TaxID=1004 RepID=A0A1K1SF57_9BACT|nr:toll/interleukin-1 receptor domain-containing protein [Chitinophaga sancti]WQD60020.1 toll/interleukin-1 receptor domain-containing protein [Chitinophaga sancti]WQG87850.1 toll/interleukin-1 receptor domain-containing protein [Chitinophaga sancti]SFW82748.1 SEFIR domain-containing protein [Chitinophaga sancti]